MRLKDLYSFKIATQQKGRREELGTLKRVARHLFSWSKELDRATWLAKDMYSGYGGGSCSYKDLAEEDKARILSHLGKFKRALLSTKDLIELIPFEEGEDEFTKAVNELKAEIKKGLENSFRKLEEAIIVCRAIDLSSSQTCKESSRKCHELLEEVEKEIGPTAVRMYRLITYLEKGHIP
jgi:hypothetical protein